MNLRTKRYRKCHKLEPVGIFYTVWYVNLFDQEPVAKKEMATTVTIYGLCVDGDMENCIIYCSIAASRKAVLYS